MHKDRNNGKEIVFDHLFSHDAREANVLTTAGKALYKHERPAWIPADLRSRETREFRPRAHASFESARVPRKFLEKMKQDPIYLINEKNSLQERSNFIYLSIKSY